MNIFCCNCQCEISAKLVTGKEVYPHRTDLYKLPFWQCPECDGFVGCHHKSSEPTKPLGCIPSPQMKNMRQRIHRVLDPLWKSGELPRGKVYALLSDHLGYQYHTAELRTVSEGNKVITFLENLSQK